MALIKTYAVRGLLEWDALLPAGKSHIRIAFRDGEMGNNGVSPAKFTTSNAALQTLIEASPDFRSGKIIQYGSATEIPDEPKPRVMRAAIDTEKFTDNEDKGRGACEATPYNGRREPGAAGGM